MEPLLLTLSMRTAVAVMLVYYAFILVACVVDTADAVITVKAVGRPVESAKLRHALGKVCKYMLYLTPFVMLDAVVLMLGWTQLPYISGVMTLCVLGIELRSMAEHARCRKDKVAKVPATLRDLIEYFGEDTVKGALLDLGRRKLDGVS